MLLSDYLTTELSKLLGASPNILMRVRLGLVEKVRPMSLYLGVLRIGDENSTPLMDILYDTTDSDRNHPVFAHIAYSGVIVAIRTFFAGSVPPILIGEPIDAI